jgi:hypothetical protein
MRTTLRIILPLIGNVVPGNVCFDRWKEILQRMEQEERRTIHRQIELVYQYICNNRAREKRSSQSRFG